MVGTFVAEAVVCVFHMCFVRKELNIKKYCSYILPFSIAGVLMAVKVRMIGSMTNGSVFGILLEVSAGAFVYIFLSGIYIYISNKKLFLRLLGMMRKK